MQTLVYELHDFLVQEFKKYGGESADINLTLNQKNERLVRIHATRESFQLQIGDIHEEEFVVQLHRDFWEDLPGAIKNCKTFIKALQHTIQ